MFLVGPGAERGRGRAGSRVEVENNDKEGWEASVGRGRRGRRDVGRRHGCVWWRAEGPVGASRDGVTWGMAVGGLEPELEPQERVGRASRLSSRSADGSLGALGRCESWVFPCSLVKVSRRRRAGMGVAGRSPAVKQVQVPACGGALPSLANLLDSSSTTCKGRTQLGRYPTGSKEPDPWRNRDAHPDI